MLTALLVVGALIVFDWTWHRRDALGARAFAGWSLSVGLVAGGAAALPGFLYAQKIVALLVMPIGLVWCGLGAAAYLARLRGENRGAALFGLAFLALGLAANPWLGRSLLAQLEEPYKRVDPYSEGPFDAVFVMGGGTGLDGRGRPILGGSGDRVMLGARLWHADVTPLLVPSGSSIAGMGRGRNVARETELIWESIDVPESAVEPVAAPRNSSEEIAAYKAMVTERGWDRVGLVTSAWHMRRAMRLADRNGLDATPLPADFRGSTGFDGLISLVPTGFGARDMHRACWEYLGSAVGR